MNRCDCGGRLLVYVTRRIDRFAIRYRKCSHCKRTTKTISVEIEKSSTDFSQLGSRIEIIETRSVQGFVSGE